MIDRITKNEKRLDSLLISVNNLEQALNDFKSKQKELALLKKYYGSKNWFQDKEAFEQQKISNVKAGVLSEDAVWNLLEDIDDLIVEMKKISNKKGSK